MITRIAHQAFPQKSNDFRPEINYLLAGFTCHSMNEKYVELLNEQKRKSQTITNYNSNNYIDWIERLLQTSLSNHRKYCIWRIITPYLINIRKLSEHDVKRIIFRLVKPVRSIKKIGL